MRIKLGYKKNSNNTTSIYLEYYYGYTRDKAGRIKHNRKYSFLDIHLITEPKNSIDRKFNKEVLQTANDVLKTKQVESLKSDFEINPEDKTKTNFFEYFLNEINGRNLHKRTLANYQSLFKHLTEFCNPDHTTFKDINEDFINRFKNHLNNSVRGNEKALMNNTKVNYYNIFKSVVTKAFKSGIISSNPFSSIKSFKYEETERTYLTFEEIQKLKNTECYKPTIKQAFLFSCFCGLRFSDLQSLKWNQIVKEKAEHRLIFKQVKTKGQEYLSLNKQAVEFLGIRGQADENVFKGLKYDITVNNSILRWVMKAGINKNVTFHTARHRFATLLLTNGVDIYTVSKLLGHKDLATTQIYAKIINPKLKEAVNKIPNLK
jgi:site-specific recombinase XerD